jgi:hypothetical protein
MKAAHITVFNCMRKSTKPRPETDRLKSKARRDIPKATSNKRLTQQIRKILGKHYANKYRAG